MRNSTDHQLFDFVIVGAGPCGTAAAVEIAKSIPDAKIALVGGEPHPAYERPLLSKSALLDLSGELPPKILYGGLQGLSTLGVSTYIPDFATDINPIEKTITLASNQTIAYSKLLLATGSAPRRLNVPGAGLQCVHYLRTFEEARSIAACLGPAKKIVIIGGGFIGLEVAATARRAGCDVTVLEAGDRLLARGVPNIISARLTEKFKQEGVKLIFNASVSALQGSEYVTGVELSDGMKLPTDAVIIGIGNIPTTELALKAGLLIEDGIVTNHDGRTSDPDIYAAGDVARGPQGLSSHPNYTKRLEAWDPAMRQGVACAKVMSGKGEAEGFSPWIWSDQFDWDLQIAGHGELADESVIREGNAPDTITVLQLYQGRLIGLVSLNDSLNMTVGRRALKSNAEVDVSLAIDRSSRFKYAFI
ncbi:NAD(P)/FAD-dependent oxidoreductase [Pseudomonas chlororaphis]|nr:FAD-dependent oxidoreductase [Pseudomonas chlororaphis]